MSLINIIVPVYQVEEYLHRCVDSILSQTFKDFSITLIDDGSYDNCGVVCDEYALTNNNILVIHQKNSGLSSARNVGINLSTYDDSIQWISFVDSDDFISSQYLDTLYKAVIYTKCDLSVCNCKIVYDQIGETTCIDISNKSFMIIETKKYYSLPIGHSTATCKLYRKYLFNSNVRFPIGKLYEDNYFTYKMIFQLDKIVFIDVQLYGYYMRSGSITHMSWTPRRFDEYEAKQEQIEYLEKRDLIDAKKFIINQYLMILSDEYFKSLHYPKENKEIKSMLNNGLKKYRNYIPKDRYVYMYNTIHPINRVFTKLKRVLKGR